MVTHDFDLESVSAISATASPWSVPRSSMKRASSRMPSPRLFEALRTAMIPVAGSSPSETYGTLASLSLRAERY